MVYKNLTFFIIIIFIISLILIMIILKYVKNILLYHPIISSHEKYNKFYHKLLKLTGYEKYVSNYVVKTPDNIMLDVVHIKNPDTDKCILFFHGNSGNFTMRFDMIKFLYNYASVLIFDYRSYGKSSGYSINLSSKELQIDTLTIWNFATKNLNIHPSRISIFGESLGCFFAIYLTAQLSKDMNSNIYPHSLILNSPFYSLSSMIENYFDRINIHFIGKLLATVIANDYKSNEWIQYINYKTKVVIAHSPLDEIIPYTEGVNLYKTISHIHKNVKFINITGTHNNCGITDNYIYVLAEIFNND